MAARCMESGTHDCAEENWQHFPALRPGAANAPVNLGVARNQRGGHPGAIVAYLMTALHGAPDRGRFSKWTW